MGDATIKFVVHHLGNLLVDEAGLQIWLRNEVKWLQTERCWVKEVVKLANRAEDVLDTHMLQTKRIQVGDVGLIESMKRYVACCFSDEFIAWRTIGKAIRGLKHDIAQIYNLVHDLGAMEDEALQARRRISPWLIDNDDAFIVGFDALQIEMVQGLVDTNIKRRTVLSIVGIGGGGKTTLAKKVYNNILSTDQFEAYGWASVSEDFQPINVLKKIAKQVIGIGSEFDKDDEEDLKMKLQNHLKAKKYFILLDDIWRTDVWDRIGGAFPNTNHGSRVLITTRSEEVAAFADLDTPHFDLPLLNDQESWNLFIANVFPRNEDTTRHNRCPQELEPVAWQLIKRCGGLPLALVVLARLLSTKGWNPIKWKRVADTMDWSATRDGETCMKIFGLSYKHLPHHHLRSCFLYLAGFPEDQFIPSHVVTRLWIAEGFIPEKQRQDVEETAEECLEELARRSMIQVESKDWDGRVAGFRIHDLFREMCLVQVAKQRQGQG